MAWIKWLRIVPRGEILWICCLVYPIKSRKFLDYVTVSFSRMVVVFEVCEIWFIGMYFHLDSVFHVFCVLFTHYADDTAGFQHMQWTLTSTVNLFIEMVWKHEACKCTWQYMFNTLKNFLYIMCLMKMDAFPLDNTELADKWITMNFSGECHTPAYIFSFMYMV